MEEKREQPRPASAAAQKTAVQQAKPSQDNPEEKQPLVQSVPVLVGSIVLFAVIAASSFYFKNKAEQPQEKPQAKSGLPDINRKMSSMPVSQPAQDEQLGQNIQVGAVAPAAFSTPVSNEPVPTEQGSREVLKILGKYQDRQIVKDFMADLAKDQVCAKFLWGTEAEKKQLATSDNQNYVAKVIIQTVQRYAMRPDFASTIMEISKDPDFVAAARSASPKADAMLSGQGLSALDPAMKKQLMDGITSGNLAKMAEQYKSLLPPGTLDPAKTDKQAQGK